MTEGEANEILDRPFPGIIDERSFGKYLGDRILAFRRLSNWNQSELAKRSGIGGSHLGRIEMGASPQVGFSTVVKIAEAFGLTPSELIGEKTCSEPRIKAATSSNEVDAQRFNKLSSEVGRLASLVARLQNGEDVREDFAAFMRDISET